MTYILHYARREGVRHSTINETQLHVTYRGVHRIKSTSQSPIGPITELERVGDNKSQVYVSSRRDEIADDGANSYFGNLLFRLLDRHKHIRRLRSKDEAEIAKQDERIEAKKVELRELRKARRQLVSAAWRRAEKIAISELEERANAHVKP